MKVLVTGGAGFIGFYVAKALRERGDEVVAIDNFNDYYDPSLKEARAEILRKLGCIVLWVDVADSSAMDELFLEHRFDRVCHLAAQAGVRYSLENPLSYERSNVLGTLNILEMCRKHDVKHLVFASSSSVYGDRGNVPFSENDRVDSPVSIYAATKKSNEEMAYAYHHLYGLNCFGLRFFTVYGAWGRPDMACYLFTDKIVDGKAIDVYNNGELSRDFSHITDITDGVIRAIDKCVGFEVINLARGKAVSLMEFIGAIEKSLGMKAEMNMLGMQKGDVHMTYADITKARKLLGYEPKMDLQEGVDDFVSWYKEFYGK